MRNGYLAAILALGALITAGQPGLRHWLAAEAQNFQQRFEELKGAGNSITPIERVVFSLALAGTTPEATLEEGP